MSRPLFNLHGHAAPWVATARDFVAQGGTVGGGLPFSTAVLGFSAVDA